MFKFFWYAACALAHHAYMSAACKRHVKKGFPKLVGKVKTQKGGEGVAKYREQY